MKKIDPIKLSMISGGGPGGATCFAAPFATLALASLSVFTAYNTMKPIVKACWNS